MVAVMDRAITIVGCCAGDYTDNRRPAVGRIFERQFRPGIDACSDEKRTRIIRRREIHRDSGRQREDRISHFRRCRDHIFHPSRTDWAEKPIRLRICPKRHGVLRNLCISIFITTGDQIVQSHSISPSILSIIFQIAPATDRRRDNVNESQSLKRGTDSATRQWVDASHSLPHFRTISSLDRSRINFPFPITASGHMTHAQKR